MFPSVWLLSLALLLVPGEFQSISSPDLAVGSELLRTSRSSPGDLEVGGELKGLQPGSTRYVRYDDLLRLPQETYLVSDDSNFK